MLTSGRIRVRVAGRVSRFPEKMKTECINCRNATPRAVGELQRNKT